MTPPISDDKFQSNFSICMYIIQIPMLRLSFLNILFTDICFLTRFFNHRKILNTHVNFTQVKSMNIDILHKSLNRFLTPNFLLSRSCKRIFLYFHFPLFSFFDSLYGCISLHTIYRNMNGMKKYFHSDSLQLSAIHCGGMNISNM